MEASTKTNSPALSGAPDELEAAATGGKVDDDGERSVLDYLLGRTYQPEHYVDVKYETAAGRMKLRLFLKALPERKMDEIDARNREGEGPFAKLDTAGFNASLVAESLYAIEDPESGRRIDPDSTAFLGGAPSVDVAIEGRFKYQPGILSSVAEEIRKLSGYSPDRVGTAQRVIQTATGNSLRAGD